MNPITALISVVVLRWTRLWSWLRRSWLGDRPFRTADADEEPDHLDPRTVYVIKDAGQSWAAVMSCPGGCGQVLHMNLLPDTKPVWKLTEHSDGTVSLTPSVWRREGCGCHFWLRSGRVNWC